MGLEPLKFLKQNILYILCFFLVLFLFQIVLKQYTYVEGFGEDPILRDIVPFRPDIKTMQSQRYTVGLFSSAMFGPANMPKSILDDVGKATDLQIRFQNFLKAPENYIRFDFKSQKPFMRDLNNPPLIDGKEAYCTSDISFYTDPLTRVEYVKSSSLPNLNTRVCNIPVTPDVLANYPLNIQNAIINYIYNFQLRLTSAKEEEIAKNAISGLNAKDMAKSVFSEDILEKRKQDKQNAFQDLENAAKESIEKIANKAQTSTAQILANPSLRQSLRPIADAARSITPMGIASTVIQNSIGPLINLIAGNATKAIADSEGWECPSGFVPGGDITSSNQVFSAVNDFFPNPITDMTNAALKTISCVRIKDGKVETTQRSRCYPNIEQSPPMLCYAGLPIKMEPVSPKPTSLACEQDKDIRLKLQIVSDYITKTTAELKDYNKILTIRQFIFVCAPCETMLECVFTIESILKVAPFTREQLTEKYYARFYFLKNACNYSVFGFTSERVDFIQQFNCGEIINYRPNPSPISAIFKHAVDTKLPNPLTYAIQNQANKRLLDTVVMAERERIQKEEQLRIEKETLLAFLNPSNNETVQMANTKRDMEELKERKSLFETYGWDRTNLLLHAATLVRLREMVAEEKEKAEILRILNRTQNPELSVFFNSLSLEQLRMRRNEKAKRDGFMKTLNPANSVPILIGLEKLDTATLEGRIRENEERNAILAKLNPGNSAVLLEELTQLDMNTLRQRLQEKTKRDPLYAYLNPTGNSLLNTTYLDKISTPELEERVKLIKLLKKPYTNNTEDIGALNTLTINILRQRVKDIEDPRQEYYVFFNPANSEFTATKLDTFTTPDLKIRKELISQLKKKDDIPTRQYYIHNNISLDDLRAQVRKDACIQPVGNDCWKPVQLRRNCLKC